MLTFNISQTRNLHKLAKETEKESFCGLTGSYYLEESIIQAAGRTDFLQCYKLKNTLLSMLHLKIYS